MIDMLLSYRGDRCYLCGSSNISKVEFVRGDYSCEDCQASYDLLDNGDVIIYGDRHYVTVSPHYHEIAILYYIDILREEIGVRFE